MCSEASQRSADRRPEPPTLGLPTMINGSSCAHNAGADCGHAAPSDKAQPGAQRLTGDAPPYHGVGRRLTATRPAPGYGGRKLVRAGCAVTLSRASADLSAGARSVEELIDGLEQGAAIPDLDPSSPNEEPHLIDKILHMRAEQDRFSAGCWLEDILPAALDEAAADEDHIGERVSRHKLADTIEDRDTPRRALMLLPKGDRQPGAAR